MESDRPTFRGLLVYRHLGHRFSLLYPEDWRQVDLDKEAGGGAVFYPDPTDPYTFLLVQSRRLRTRIQSVDLDTLREGFLDGLHQLPGLALESEEAHTVEPLVDLQARHTYRDGDATRKRWIRVLYQGTVQITLIAQGSTETAFQYWLPMFNTVMRTVQFADWWADATGKSWVRTLVKPRRGRAQKGAARP
jgi:hypothetical protein